MEKKTQYCQKSYKSIRKIVETYASDTSLHIYTGQLIWCMDQC